MIVSRAIVCLVLASLVPSCASLESVRSKNRESLGSLTQGMSEEQVRNVMGDEAINTYNPFRLHPSLCCLPITWPVSLLFPERIENPYRTEAGVSDSGEQVLILLYYTDKKAADDGLTDDELTPIVLVDGMVRGWGWNFVRGNVQYQDLTIRVR